MASRLKNRVKKLELRGGKFNVAGIIIYFENAKSSIDDGDEGFIKADCYLDKYGSSEKMSLKQVKEYVKANEHTCIVYLPIQDKEKDIHYIKVERLQEI